MILVIIGSFVVSCALAYAWWTRVRVVDLKQDLFSIRDELFLQAVRAKATEDSALRAARHRLNVIIGTADILATGPVLLYIHAQKWSPPERPASRKPELNEAIRDAMESVDARIARFVLHQTLMGIVLRWYARLLMPEPHLVESEARRVVSSVVETGGPLLEKMLDLRTRGTAARAVA